MTKTNKLAIVERGVRLSERDWIEFVMMAGDLVTKSCCICSNLFEGPPFMGICRSCAFIHFHDEFTSTFL